MLVPPLVLALICAVCCAFLALANHVTKDKIAAAEADAIQTSLKQLPDAGDFEKVADFTPQNNEKASATGLYQDEKGQYAVLVTADGYNKGGLQVVIGVDKEHEGNPDEWDIVLDTNIKALLAMTRLVVPGMVERGRGHVINMGSIAGDYAYPGGSVYCASKAAVKALSDGLRIDLVDTPVRVTNIKPGLVETNFSVVRFRGDKAAADNVYKGIRPLTGDDIAEVVYFAAAVPEHIQVAEVLVMPTNQATGTIVSRK